MATQPNPNSVAAGKVIGRGSFAIASCPDTDGVRRIHLFETRLERNARLWRYDRNGKCACDSVCTGDHPVCDFE